ncbi:MAG: hypothetical protein LUD77_01930 [Clostridiales bacterium]|nr:hypothetical protein [Clostridiales bacterium]
MDNVNGAFNDFQTSLQGVSDSARELNKLSFQVELGDNIDQETYMAAADKYIANLQTAVKDKQYSLNLNIDLLFGGTEFGTGFSEDANEFYGRLSGQAAQLGEALKTATINAYEHNWDISSTEAVAAILKQQAEIQEQISTAQSEAKLETLKYDFATGDLSPESFQNLIDATNTELATLKETYTTARVDAIAAAKLMYDEGTSKLSTAISEANARYNEQISGLSAIGLSFENDAVMGAYSEEFATVSQKAAEMFDGSLFWDTVNQKLSEGNTFL